MVNRKRIYGRGILRFTSLEPCRLPGQIVASSGVNKREEERDNSRVQNGVPKTPENVPTVPPHNGDKPVRLLAKYSYKANPSKPGGFDELTVTQGEKLELCRAHPSNPHWWEARNENGDIGFVPATYMMVLEEKISTLPWLANKKQEIEEAKPVETFHEPAFKPYVSGKALITVLTAYMYLKWEKR
ncbi:high osmolarity signaling protein SHO1-like [Orbicella faveolata]|uniref:high osmolarity signaling protein SHO1-like n=1 Tax=Orbicella faveolata TaxID=48498 RepID=UPI0009E316FD|nr:high osmolarity signaling protein SHO1-like [Orbicella faveolata]